VHALELLAPVVSNLDLGWFEHVDVHLLEVLDVVVEPHLDELLLVLLCLDVPAQVFLDLDAGHHLAVVSDPIAESPQSVHPPLGLQLGSRSVLGHLLVEAELAEDVNPEGPLDHRGSSVHLGLDLLALNQLVELEDVHVHHGVIIQILNLRVVVEQVFHHEAAVDDVLRHPTHLLVGIVDLNERYLLLELLPRSSAQTAVTDHVEFRGRRLVQLGCLRDLAAVALRRHAGGTATTVETVFRPAAPHGIVEGQKFVFILEEVDPLLFVDLLLALFVF